MAHIVKRGKSYTVRVSCGYDINGKQIFKNKTFRPPEGLSAKQEKKALDEFVLDFERQAKLGRVLDGNIRFVEFCEKWFKDYAEGNLQPKTLQRYKEFAARCNQAIGNIKLEDIRPHHLNDFYSNLAEPGMNKRTGGFLSPKTIQEHHRFISKVLNTAVQWQIIYENPATRATPPKVKQAEVLYLDEEQAKMVITALEQEEQKYKTALILAIYSGLRRGELCGLKWQDIDFEGKIISVRRTLQYLASIGLYEKEPKTKSSLRSLKLPDEIFHLLREHKSWQDEQRTAHGTAWEDNDYILTQQDGKPMHPDTLTDFFSRLAKKLDLPKGISFHSLRHTSATLLIAGGMSPRTVASRLGHAQVSTTMNIYSHQLQSADAKAAEVLSDMLNPVKLDK